MEANNKNIDILAYVAYGDAVGFLKQNDNNSNNEGLHPFSYSYSEDLKLKADTGQWSYITQLMLINCKCLVDNKDNRHVLIDYKRMIEEIKLWKYYRYGTPLNYIYKLKLGNQYYKDDFYWNDKRGEAFSRIIPIALANKNFNAAQEEVYKNIIYINRHPQVVLTGLLLLKTIFFLIKNKLIEKKQLIDELKNYLIHLQLLELEEYVNGQLPSNYKIRFEQEKINYLIDLDRLKDSDTYSFDTYDSKNILITSLNNLLNIHTDIGYMSNLLKCKEKEVYAITYGLLALIKQADKIVINQIKDISFIRSMGEYVFKLREYEVGRILFEKRDNEIDLFSLNKGAMLKHPLLNNIRIKDKVQFSNYIELTVESKSGEYKFIIQKNQDSF
ncbi:hypothetical protein KQI88_10200 [Alkaliphilus sp. MSJ-5]|uniref:ADP-ribosylglycohydrolase n=1 Tax=Alkaliphilus flagellatus TaxID=2841507 RepID=A0ABS6G3P5_9FIRM|nr:hypothetical protein [Alkaliphilus flagellatus]MBU5676789.1 hypothetical protein [Alkaliphilus flagellatus]